MNHVHVIVTLSCCLGYSMPNRGKQTGEVTKSRALRISVEFDGKYLKDKQMQQQ